MRRLTSILVFASAVTMSGTIGCGSGQDATPRPLPGVVLFCVDTLRADALRSPETGATQLPSLARFARGAVTFADATANAPWTCPSVACLLTGLHARRNGAPLGSHDASFGKVPAQVGTLAQTLRAKGWSTAAFTGGGWVSPEMGLASGFDVFSTNFDLHAPSFTVHGWNEQRAKDRPFLLFLHTFAAHDPYGNKDLSHGGGCPPPQAVQLLGARLASALDVGQGVDDDLYAEFFAARWSDVCSRSPLDRVLGPNRLQQLLDRLGTWQQGGWAKAPGADLPLRLRTAYEAGLAHADERIDQTLRAIEGLGLPEGTILVIAGDHGEAFGEGGHLLHGQSLHDAVLRVPLLVRAPGRFPEGTVVQGGCSLVDVMPTILDLAGVPPLAPLDGRSLAPLATGRDVGSPAVAEGEVAATGDSPPLGLASVRTPAAKWVYAWNLRTGATVREEVFDLEEDAGERAPLRVSETARFGEEFCRAVGGVRADVGSRYAIPAAAPACP